MKNSQKSLRDTAIRWAAAGLSVVPIRPDGSKAPAIKTWTELEGRILTPEEIDKYFKPGLGIAIIGGEVSGNLEFLDFDIPKDESGDIIGVCVGSGDDARFENECIFDAWLDCLDTDLFDLVKSMPTVRTPGGGVHLYYRCASLEGSRKLAMQENPPGIVPSKSTIAETRGRGGYVLVPGCPPQCHPSGKTYEFISGSFDDGGGVPTITAGQRAALFAAVRSFDRVGLAEKEARRRNTSAKSVAQHDGNRPGDDYNRRASWEDILESLGWTFAYTRRHDKADCWRRPGKSRRERGISATVRTFDGVELFHSFSSNCDPFPHDESITKFTAYALIHHGGDYEAAARDLGSQGYGDPPRRTLDLDTVIDGKRDDGVPWNDEYPGVNSRIYELEFSEEEGEQSRPFTDSSPPTSASIFHEEVDPIEVLLFEDEKRLKLEESERKIKEKIKLRELQMAKGPGYLVWRDFGDPPQRVLTSDGRIKTKIDCPRDTAWIIINDRFSKDDLRTIHYQNEQFMVWNGSRYRALKPDDVRPMISQYLSHFAEFKGEDENGNPVYEPFKVRDVRIVEMVKSVKDMCHIDSEILDPCWLGKPHDESDLPDPREVVCCKNGLLDIARRELMPPTPAFYSFNNTEIIYDPEAPKPSTWLKFLNDSLDKESQLLLQQWFGYCLVQDTRLQKMLMVVGQPGSGKGTAMSILRRLVGDSSCCAMSFERFDANFGLQNALGKSLMIFPDARQNAKFDIKGSAIGALLSITGEDEIQIDRKNREPITKALNTRVVIVSNDVMQLTDRSKALSRRILWIKFPGHEGESDPNLKSKLFKELSGILNWAIDGWAMVRETGGFIQPKSAEVLKDSFEEQSSDIASFIDDMCIIGPDQSVEKVELVNHWNAWRISKGYRKMGEATFGKLLSSAVMRLGTAKPRSSGGGRRRLYTGVGLDSDKVRDYINQYGGPEIWRDLLRPMKSSGGDGGGVIGIAEYLANKDKK